MMKALLFYWDAGAPRRGARGADRRRAAADLIGTKPHCLVPPASGKGSLPRYMLRARAGGRKQASRA